MNINDCLPNEVLSYIFSFCDQPDEKNNIRQVCRQWQENLGITKFVFPKERKVLVLNNEHCEYLKFFKYQCFFLNNSLSSLENDENVIVIDDQTSSEFLNPLQQIDEQNVLKALLLSEQYKIKSLKKKCNKFISDVIINAIKENNKEKIVELVNCLKEINIPLKLDFSNANFLCDEHLELLKELPLRCLDLSHCKNITNEGLAFLKGKPLKSLSLKCCCKITEDGLAHLKGMPLEYLNLYDCQDIGGGLKFLKGMPLKYLNLVECYLDDGELACLEGMPLEYLNLLHSNSPLKDEDFACLRGLPLKYLDLTECAITDLGCLEGMPLETLDLTGCRELTDTGIQSLSKLPFLQTLILPDGLFKTIITHKGLKSLKNLPLQSLYVHDLTDKGVKKLMGLPLQSLEISGGEITNEGLKLLRGMPLKSLVLYCCHNITNEGLENLNELPLQKLTVTNCNNITGQEYYSDYSAEDEYYDASEYEDAIEDGSFLEESEYVYDVAEAEESEEEMYNATDTEDDSFAESDLIKEMDLDTPKEKGF